MADDYLSAAKLAFGDTKVGTGPVRLMSYHAAALFLKTYMRSAGETVDALRALGHDLERMVVRAKALGLKLPAQILAQSRKLSANNDYMRARYVVVREPTDISDESVLRKPTTRNKRQPGRHEQRDVDDKAESRVPQNRAPGSNVVEQKRLPIAAR